MDKHTRQQMCTCSYQTNAFAEGLHKDTHKSTTFGRCRNTTTNKQSKPVSVRDFKPGFIGVYCQVLKE